MANFSVGIFKAAVLVSGTVLIGVLSFAAGAVLLQSPAGDVDPNTGAGAGGSGTAAAAGSGAPAGGAGESEDTAGLSSFVPDPLRSEVRGKVAIYGTRIGDAAGDQFVAGAGAASEPVANALTAGAGAVLPSFIGDKVPWMTSHVRSSVISSGKSQVGGVFENAYNDALAGDMDIPGRGGSAAGGGAVAKEGEPAGDEGAHADAFVSAAAGGGEAETPNDIDAYVGAGSVATGTARWTIQMARFATMRNAEAFAAEMAARGVSASVHIEKAGGRWWNVVRAGSYERKGAAEAALGDLRRRGFGGAVVTESTRGIRG